MTRVPTPAGDEWRKAPSRKDTKRWCKGKVGRDHTPIIRRRDMGFLNKRPCQMITDEREMWNWVLEDQSVPWLCFHEEACSTCGKVLKWHSMWQQCPDLPEEYRG